MSSSLAPQATAASLKEEKASSAKRPLRPGTWSESALRVLRERYLAREGQTVLETPEEMCWRVAVCIASAEAKYGKTAEQVEAIAQQFYDLMADSIFLPNSPTLMNAGKNNGLQYSACYVLPVGDSMEEIFESVKNSAIIHKCLVGETLVMTEKGLTRLSDVPGGASVMTDEGPFPVSALHDNGEQPVFEVRTHRGFKIVGTAEHRLLAVDGDGGHRWRRIAEIREGDWLAVKPGSWIGGEAKLPEFTFEQKPGRNGTSYKATEYRLPQELSPELGEFIGLYIGDGSNHRDGIRFTVGDDFPEVVERLKELSSSLFGKKPSISRYSDERAVEVSVLSTQIRQWFDFLGITKTSSREAHVPQIILRGPGVVAAAFVRGLFTADGCIRESGHITLTTASERLAEDLQIVMLALGIPTHLRPDVSATGYRSYQVSVCTKAGFLAFREKVGFLDRKKRARLAAIEEGRIFVKGETIPNQRERLRNWYDSLSGETRVQAKSFFSDLLNRVKDPRELSRQRVTAVMEKTAAFPPFFEDLAADDVFFVRVTAIGYVGTRRVYDLTVPLKHAYLANGFVSHNSGGGTGFAFSRLRPKDALVRSTGGKASGPVSFLRVFNGATEAVKQGGTRRGANMGILRVDHPDILEFIDCKLDGGITNFNISVAITERFMEALRADAEYDLVEPHTGAVTGRLRAKEVFDRIVQAAWKTGDPGLFFVDRCNAGPANPTPTLDKVEATNPCFAGDTLIATDRGLVRMAELAGAFAQGGIAVQVDPRLMPSQFLVFEATHNVPVSSYDHGCLPISRAFCSGERETVRVRTKSGLELVCTPDHRVMTTRGWVPAGELRIGADCLFVQSNHGAFGSDPRLPFEVANEVRGRNGRISRHALPAVWSRELGLVLGTLVGDGWLRSGDKNCRVGFTFGSGNLALLEALKGKLDAWYGRPVRAVRRPNGVYHLSYHGRFFVEFFERLGVRPVQAAAKVVPETLFRAPREAVVGFLQGLFTADGTVRDNPQSNGAWIALTSKSRELLRGVQLLLLQLGIKSQIMERSRPARDGVFPYRTRGGATRSFTTDGVLFELGIFGESREVFRREIGFLNARQRRLESVRYGRFYRQKLTDVVVAIEPNGIQRVYDLTEPNSHTVIANGIVAHQCGEQPLYPAEACNLASLNLAKFVKLGDTAEGIDWAGMERAIRLSVRFLDDVIEVNPYPLPEINEAVKKNRRIGLGVMGWADMLCCLGIPYDSEAAIALGDRVMAFVQEKGHEESRRLAEERGPFPTWPQSIYREKGMLRNSTVTTIAPTGTISIIADCSSGIEPLFAVAFEHRVGERRLSFVNKHFEAVAKARGFASDALMQKVAERGTLHGLTEVPEDVRRVFVTAHEVAPEWHVRHQAVFQRHTDNGVSKCVAGDTLIFTDRGILRIQDLYGGESPDAFTPVELKVADWGGPVEADLFYFGGKRDIVGLETDLGFSLRATPIHRVRVMANGEIVWRRMDEIQVGDFLVVPYGFGIYGHLHDFKAIYGAYYHPAERSNANRLQWPRKITTDLARLLGYLIADGGFSRNQVIFTQQDDQVFDDYRQIMQRRFGVEPRASLDSRRENLKQAVVNSRDLIAFFSDYLGTGDRADNKRTPRCILASGPEVMKDYVRGLTLDGYVSGAGRMIVLGTVSRRLAEEVQAILLNLGIVARLETKAIHYDYRHEENRKDACYEVVVISKFRRAFLERIGFAEERKNRLASEQLQRKRHPDTLYVVPGVRPLAVSLARIKMAGASSRRLHDYLRSFITAEAEVTEETIEWLLDITRELQGTQEWKTLASVVGRGVMYTPVTNLWTDKEEVFDLQVPSTHSFVTNGLISHNTINLPNSATPEDVQKAYLMAYETGCIGITVFRDGCKGTQVLHVGTGAKEKEKAKEQEVEAPAATPAPPVPVQPRPRVVQGVTYRTQTPLGTAYITVNQNPQGEPLEVFANVGKVGSETAAVSEAIGRLVSLCLRLASPVAATERVKQIVEQLAGIGGSRHLGFGKERVRSLPDAIAKVLAEHVGMIEAEEQSTPQLTLPERTGPPIKVGDPCPECGEATLAYEEGCLKCYGCGFAEC